MSDKKPDTSANEFVRELSDTELVGLTILVDQRVQALLGQGVPLPMQEIENHHIIGLLECFVGPEESLRVKEYHVTWLDRRLDMVEAGMRAQMLKSGLFDGGLDEQARSFLDGAKS